MGQRFAGFGALVFVTAILILLAIYFGLDHNRAHSTTVVPIPIPANASCDLERELSSTCTSSDPCKLGYYLPSLGVCDYVYVLNGTACADKCYIEDSATTCDNTFSCSGDATQCRGYCTQDSDCNASIPMNTYWLTANWTVGDGGDDGPYFYGYQYICEWNRCEAFFLYRLIQTDPLNTGDIVSYASCKDYLAVDFLLAERYECLSVENYVLAVNLTSSIFDVGSDYPAQLAMCSYYYDCAPFNQTAIQDNKRSLPSSAGDRYEEVARHLLGRHQ